jgi:uncharacterized protein (TIGR02611 family)
VQLGTSYLPLAIRLRILTEEYWLMDRTILKTIKQAKRLIIIVIGFTVLLMGIAMIVLPGPAVLVIPLGLGILASELVWARRILHKIKSRFLKQESTREK